MFSFVPNLKGQCSTLAVVALPLGLSTSDFLLEASTSPDKHDSP